MSVDGGGVNEDGTLIKRSRLPNFCKTVLKSTPPAMGSFTTYVWEIKNILLLKKIFDTPKVPLLLTR
jgi:hypothetical protein